jgi:hypothetical protein
MANKSIGIVIIILGVIVAIVAIFADFIGIGNKSGFGWQQIVGTAVGVIAVIIGVWFAQRKASPK